MLVIMLLIMFLVSCLIMYVIPGLIRKPPEADPGASLMYLSRSLGFHPNLRHAFRRVVDSDAILPGDLPMFPHLLRNL